MPATSQAGRKGPLGMTRQQLQDFARTPRKGLPKHSGKVSMGSLGEYMKEGK